MYVENCRVNILFMESLPKEYILLMKVKVF